MFREERRVRLRWRGQVLADSRRCIRLEETGYPPVFYFPADDVALEHLRRTNHHSYCPFKGEASYYSVTTAAGDTVNDVIWTYEQPYPAVAAIAGHVAFYPNKAEITISP